MACAGLIRSWRNVSSGRWQQTARSQVLTQHRRLGRRPQTQDIREVAIKLQFGPGPALANWTRSAYARHGRAWRFCAPDTQWVQAPQENSIMTKTAFFAYPAEPIFLGEAIHDAIPKARSADDLIITPWSKLNIIGLKLDELIRERLAGADFILADVTYPNFNVYYEIGYAVGQQR